MSWFEMFKMIIITTTYIKNLQSVKQTLSLYKGLTFLYLQNVDVVRTLLF